MLPWFYFFSGALRSVRWFYRISGSFLLLIFGKIRDDFWKAVGDRHVVTLALFSLRLYRWNSLFFSRVDFLVSQKILCQQSALPIPDLCWVQWISFGLWESWSQLSGTHPVGAKSRFWQYLYFRSHTLEQTAWNPQMGMAIVGFLFGIFLVIGNWSIGQPYLKKAWESLAWSFSIIGHSFFEEIFHRKVRKRKESESVASNYIGNPEVSNSRLFLAEIQIWRHLCDNSLQRASYWLDDDLLPIFVLEIGAFNSHSIQKGKFSRKLIPIHGFKNSFKNWLGESNTKGACAWNWRGFLRQ